MAPAMKTETMVKEKTRFSALALLALVALGLASCPNSCPPAGPTPFADIVAANPAEYGNYLMKLTFMGPQTAPVTTVVFGSASPLDVNVFRPYRRATLDYQNDELDFARFEASAAEVERIVKAIEPDGTFTDPQERPDPIYSFMIMRDVGGPNETVFETLVVDPDSPRLLTDFIRPNLDPSNAHGLELTLFFLKNVGG